MQNKGPWEGAQNREGPSHGIAKKAIPKAERKEKLAWLFEKGPRLEPNAERKEGGERHF